MTSNTNRHAQEKAQQEKNRLEAQDAHNKVPSSQAHEEESDLEKHGHETFSKDSE